MIFVTGADGFVGSELCRELRARHIPYKAGVRKMKNQMENELAYGDMLMQKDWTTLLKGVDVVFHLAARVHVMNELNENPLEAFRQMNVGVSVQLARAAKEAGVKRFIFLSSVKVNGESTSVNPFSAGDTPAPEDAYGSSKFEAEKALLELNEKGVFEVVIVRPPLIYGKDVKANFRNLINLVKRGLPLPFGLVNNKRSLISVLNLVDFLILCSHHPQAGGRVFLVSDDNDLSLKELIGKIAHVTQKRIILLPVPVSLMRAFTTIIGKKNFAERLFGNLQVDITETKKLLNWKPLKSFEETFRN